MAIEKWMNVIMIYIYIFNNHIKYSSIVVYIYLCIDDNTYYIVCSMFLFYNR